MVNPATHSSSRKHHAGKPTLNEALTRVRLAPSDPQAWRDLGRLHLQEKRPAEAEKALARSIELDEAHAETWALRGSAATDLGNEPLAEASFRRALSLDEHNINGLCGLASIHFRRGEHADALALAEKVLARAPGNVAAMHRKAQVLVHTHHLEEARLLTQQLVEREPANRYVHLNNLANILRDLGDLPAALEAYQRSAKLAENNPGPLSNQITLAHYLPEVMPEDILALCKEWGRRFAPPTATARTQTDRSPSRRLKIGLISDGFRQHPVGAMITPAMKHLPQLGLDLYCYSSFSGQDWITRRLQAVAKKWTHIGTLDDAGVTQLVRDDAIDILIDLSGHNAGTRMRVMAAEPAPVLIKWVGGLISTTGVSSIDYLISDNIESPHGSDMLYTEKLIRMPDDYICYLPPKEVPEIGPLPATRNGYLTFGCFNNPTKINDILLAEWAKLMLEHPRSRLLLKGNAFGFEYKRQHVLREMAKHGIDADRLIMEGHSDHYQLFDTYNRVDIALDPWPYSGGLTTCEALLMGVPVVTLPGPTFAGRHSATHLANAGLPELIAEDWDGYRACIASLAADLDGLTRIRSHLRGIVLGSPVCDGERFARNLACALRSVWQRQCEGKPPAGLAFTPDGKPWFEDEEEPRDISVDGGAFKFSFNGKITVLDHGGTLVSDPNFSNLASLGVVSTVILDPAGKIKNAKELQELNRIQQYHSHVTLGNGHPGILYACLDASFSSTLPPRLPDEQPPSWRSAATVLAKVPISTVRLDEAEGLERLDWLILDAAHDNKGILQNAQETLRSTLLLQIRIPIVNAYEGQTTLDDACKILRPAGLHLLRLDNARYHSFLPEDLIDSRFAPSSQQLHSDALFVPSGSRLQALSRDQRLRLAFITHTAYGLLDYAFHVLQSVDPTLAQQYLNEQLISLQPATQPLPANAPLASTGFTIPDTPHMEPAGIELLRKHLSGSRIFLEYGSGGSSVMATKMRVGKIYSVDSDLAFLNAVQSKLLENAGSSYLPIYVNIGPTGDWGHPTSRECAHMWPNYVREPWSRLSDAGEKPDLVLIDGRFRIASFLTSLLHAPAGCVILFDDYVDRPSYHVVERYLKPARLAGRMAQFLVPTQRPAGLEKAIDQYCQDPS